MKHSVNSSNDNLADIVGMQAITDASAGSPVFVVVITLCVVILFIFIYLRVIHGFKGQLRHIKYQLNHSLILPRDAAHTLAKLKPKSSFNVAQIHQLKTLRFAPKVPTAHQIIEFINHVG